MSALLCGQFGYLFYYSYSIREIKESTAREIISGLPESVFVPVVLEDIKASISWDEESKEFSLNGEIFDLAIVKNDLFISDLDQKPVVIPYGFSSACFYTAHKIVSPFGQVITPLPNFV